MLHQERGIVVGLINKQIPTLLRFHHTTSLISFIAMWQTRKILTLELSNHICNKENPPKLLTKLPKILLILRIKEKEQKEAWKARKEENRAIGQKQNYSDKYRVLIHHPTPRRDARRLGVDEAARKMTLHQGLNA
ncbi:hypothetical protein PIB30_100170 [Stylosanthes scabra]|uniref:Uncharacterized protein n=1 Tax=Stylosanthes scabra TaxID=79078 RepID=A0ABU6YUS1_9FABA|nr:hypothetical protein [Stylosanthes scabra]